MVTDQGIGKRLSDGGLGQSGDPSLMNLGGAPGYYVDEQGLPLDIHQWPPQKYSVKAEYERPYRYDDEGRIIETLNVLLPSTPNKDMKWLRRGWFRVRYVDSRATGADILPRFNQGLGARRQQKQETLTEYRARQQEQRIRAEERARIEAESAAEDEDGDEVEVELPAGMELEVPDEVAQLKAELERVSREKEVAQKTLADVLERQNPIAQPAEALAEHVPAEPPADPKEAQRAAASERMKAYHAAKRAEKEAAA